MGSGIFELLRLLDTKPLEHEFGHNVIVLVEFCVDPRLREFDVVLPLFLVVLSDALGVRFVILLGFSLESVGMERVKLVVTNLADRRDVRTHVAAYPPDLVISL